MNHCKCGCGAPTSMTFAVGHSRRRPVADRLRARERQHPCSKYLSRAQRRGLNAAAIDHLIAAEQATPKEPTP